MARGVEAIELDVRASAEGTLWVAHGDEVGARRISTSRDREISAESQVMCTLAAALGAIPDDCLLDIEVKVAGIESATVDVVRAFRDVARAAVTSFEAQAVAEFKRIEPGLTAGLLVRPHAAFGKAPRTGDVVSMLTRCQADFVGLHVSMINESVADQFSREGYPICAWTVDGADAARSLLSLQSPVSIITNHPLEMMRLRESLS